MNAGLSFIMANHAKVKENDLVFDPFVGTGKFMLSLLSIQSHVIEINHLCFVFSLLVSGSLLVACSHFGAYVCGTDIDYNTIHGKGILYHLHRYNLTCRI